MANRADRQRIRKHYLSVALAVLFAVLPSLCFGAYRDVAEIKLFGLLDVSGRFRASYLFDDRERGSGQSSSFETRSTWEEEFFLLTESYVYHPGFLNMDIGGGPVFVQQEFEATPGQNSSSDTLFNFLTRFNFLQLKRYPFSLYYERSHPGVTTSLAGRFLTESDAYGMNGGISRVFGGSTSMRFEVGSRATQGSGLGSVVDDEIDSGLFLITTNYRDTDRLELRYDRIDTVSASGSAGLAIYRSEISQEIGTITSENWFGREDRLKIRQVLRRLQHETEAASSSTLDDRNYTADVHYNINEETRSYLRYQQYDTRHTSSESESQNVVFGLMGQAKESLRFDSAVEYLSSEQTGFHRDMSTLRGSVNYSRDVGFGRLGLFASLRGSRTDQESSAGDIQVFDEAHVLNGTTPVDLANEFVISGSVVVSNAARTQIFVEGFDYRLMVTGSVTSIQRLLNGSIADGQTVVVDYSYETSGTAEFDTLGSGFSANIGFLNTMNVFLRYNVQDTNIRSGEFTNPVNDRKSLEVGVGASNQFLGGWSLSGEYRHKDQDEDISPFVSDSLNVSLTKNLAGLWRLTAASSLSIVDFENSSEDINQISYRLGLSGRLFRRALITYDVAYLSDDGGSLPREQLRHRFKFQWAYRQVRFVLDAFVAADTLGVSENDDMQVTARLMRVF